SGIERLRTALGAGDSLKLMCHAVCGYPDLATSGRIFAATAEGGADIIEAQIPFSEPSADGPLIVEANHAALRALRGSGASRTRACLELLGEARRVAGKPFLVMSYINPIFAYGPVRFVREAARLGLDGLIVPDYPDDEQELELGRHCAEAGLALVPLIAPTTPLERAVSLAAASESPLLYAVLRLGVTGRKTEIDGDGAARLAELRSRTGKKVAAGFGLRERSQLAALRASADCAIVGSALLATAKEAIAEGRDPADAVAAFVRSLKS
ncbi:MAG: tryptophan synthase subunit alpha, partial [Spirochaetaceae bacterium]|nr:tryptophan synthase subunit alpha [Spirochaetaceae bacterium]